MGREWARNFPHSVPLLINYSTTRMMNVVENFYNSIMLFVFSPALLSVFLNCLARSPQLYQTIEIVLVSKRKENIWKIILLFQLMPITEQFVKLLWFYLLGQRGWSNFKKINSDDACQTYWIETSWSTAITRLALLTEQSKRK